MPKEMDKKIDEYTLANLAGTGVSSLRGTIFNLIGGPTDDIQRFWWHNNAGMDHTVESDDGDTTAFHSDPNDINGLDDDEGDEEKGDGDGKDGEDSD